MLLDYCLAKGRRQKKKTSKFRFSAEFFFTPPPPPYFSFRSQLWGNLAASYHRQTRRSEPSEMELASQRAPTIKKNRKTRIIRTYSTLQIRPISELQIRPISESIQQALLVTTRLLRSLRLLNKPVIISLDNMINMQLQV